MSVVVEGGEAVNVSGHRCRKGVEYAHRELENPCRMLTSTVRSRLPGFPRISVSSSRAIPRGQVTVWMKELSQLVVEKTMVPGEVLAHNFLDSGIDLIVTQDCREAGELYQVGLQFRSDYTVNKKEEGQDGQK